MSYSPSNVVKKWLLKADLSPPLGYPGGSCHLMERIESRVRSPAQKEKLIEKVELGDKLTNQEAHVIYDYELDKGAKQTRFQAIVMTPHAQYRMDQRGIRVNELILTLTAFHKAWAKEKSRNSSRYQDWEKKIQRGKPLEWTDSGLTVVFEVASIRGKLAANIITAFKDTRNPLPKDREECEPWKGWAKDRPQPSALERLKLGKRWVDPNIREAPRPGIQTYVSEKSQKGLPNDSSSEKQVVLPLPGSATPGGAGRDIGKFEYNTPGPDSDIKPRTLSEPGEERGHPTNWSVDTFKRRTMTSGEIEEEETESEGGLSKTAYKRRWKPGKRQRKSRGKTRVKRKQYNRKNKAKRKMYAKRWRKKNKNKGAFKQSQKRRNKSVRKRRGSLDLSPQRVAEMYKELNFEVVGESVDGEEAAQPGRVRKQDRPKTIKQRLNPTPLSPKKLASVLTVPEIAFGIGPDMTLGYVDSLSPMSGMVTFRLAGPGVPPLDSMEVPTFLRLAAFLTEDDMEAFFNLVDAELGEDAYGDLDEEGLRDCAAMYDIDVDSDNFRLNCLDLMGESDLGSMDPDALERVNSELVVGIMGSEFPRSQEDARDGDDLISEFYDPHLYYGEVDREES